LVSGSVRRIRCNSLLFFNCSSLFFSIMNMTLFYFNILVMTLLYLFIFAVLLFLVYHSYILGLVRLDLYTCLGSYSVYPSDLWVNGRYCVGVVLIPYLSVIVPNMPYRGVVCDSDSFIDSYIVSLSCIGLAEQHYYREWLQFFSFSLLISLCMGVVLSRNDCWVCLH